MFADCSIVIPNYNGSTLLRLNLPSVLTECDRYPGKCQVIVVDDASDDDSIDVLTEEFPGVELVRHESNRGFAEAVRSGVDAAVHELVFLLNSDVFLQPDCLARLQNYFADDNTFAASPLILNQDNRINQASWPRSRFVRGHLKLVRPVGASMALSMDDPVFSAGTDNRRLFTPYCSGGSVMLRRSMFIALGGFCGLYKPFYYEDFDLGLRAWYRGWPSYFVPEARVVHADKGAIENHFRSEYIKCMQRRNRYFLEWVHFPAGRLIFSTIPFMLLRLAGELLLWDRKNLKAFYLALTRMNDVVRARREAKGGVYTLNDVLELTTRKQV